MNKKAFLLAEETLKMVIALISISFLIYFLSALYFTNQTSKGLELAEATLENLIESANSGIEEVEIYNPEGWVLSSWPYDVKKSRIVYDEEIKNDIPKSCSDLGWKNCVCICDSAINFESSDCDKAGICLKSEYNVVGDVIELEDLPLNLLIDKENKKITKK